MSSLYSLQVCFFFGPEIMVTVAELKSLYVDSIPRDISELVFADHLLFFFLDIGYIFLFLIFFKLSRFFCFCF